MDLQFGLTLLNTAIGVLIGFGLTRAAKRSDDNGEKLDTIKDGVAKINGSVRSLYMWTESHEKLDDEREKNNGREFSRVHNEHQELWRAMEKVRGEK